MQNDVVKILGVSPAYFVSKYGTAFSCKQVRDELPMLKKLGFNSVQFEVFEKSMLSGWSSGGLNKAFRDAANIGLNVPVFVAHYIGRHFEVPSDPGILVAAAELKELLDLLKETDNSIPLAVPVMPLSKMIREEEAESLKSTACELIKELSMIAAIYNRRLILEIVPGSVVGCYHDFMEGEPWRSLDEKIGFLLDTGHANVCREEIPELIIKMNGRLRVLHISDNDGLVNLSLKPGDGDIDWIAVLTALDESGYRGSLELEIVSSSEEVEEQYREGLVVLKSFIGQQMRLKELV